MHYDHIIVGAGSMGAAAGYFLSKKGKSVLMLDAFNPPHDFGSHHGDTRLIRYAYGEGDFYVPFVLRARDLWKQLEEESGARIFNQTGIINVGKKGDAFLETVESSAEKFNLPLLLLDAKETMDKWPGIQMPEDFVTCYEETSGVLYTKQAIESFIKIATQNGAVLKTNSKVISVNTLNQTTVEVVTENGETYTANNVILTTGAWAKQMLDNAGVSVPLRPIRKTFAWFEAEEALYGDSQFPGFSFQYGDACYYGFPSIDGVGVKVGRHDLGDAVDPDDDKIPFGEVTGDKEDLQDFLQTFLPQVGELKFGKTCMYSMTPDEHFIIDKVPGKENIIVAAGFSGHGFKFASAVGELLSQMALNEKIDLNIEAFSIARF